ncbi:MAG: hypothetical protein AAGJ70_04135 [Pseudomonadota bacterium]
MNVRKTVCQKRGRFAGAIVCLALAGLIFTVRTAPPAYAEGQRWCGTDSTGPLGALSSLVPQRFPTSRKANQCGGRHAKLWRACRTHDVCYWNLNVPIAACQSRFKPNLITECRRAFVQHRRARTDATCDTMFHKCARLAATFDFVVGKYDRLTGTADDARAEARRTLRRLKQIAGEARVNARGRFARSRIAHYCARIKVANACDHRRVARIVAGEL